jgi:hypothetical protein
MSNHSCVQVIASDIGFDRSYNGKNAVSLGRGVYFARDAMYSSNPKYSVPDADGVQRMLLCRVAVGRFCKGTAGCHRPHLPGSTTECFDTTVDSVDDPSMFVTFKDHQA